MGSELKIKVLAELAGVEKLSEKFKILAAAAKDADYQFRQGKMSSDQLKASLASIQKMGDSLNGTYKQNVDLTATLYQVQQRANVGFKSLAVSLDEISNKMQKTNPAFVSFNQIVQDAPFGIRGVGNNIQFLTQQFTQLRSTGMQTNEILKGMIGNALQPMGLLMLGVSVGTSLLTVAMDSLGASTEKTKEKAFDLNEELKRQKEMQEDIRTAQYASGAVSASQRIKDLMIELKALQLQRSAMFDIMQMRNGNMPASFNASNFDTTLRAPGTTSAGAFSTGVSTSPNIEKMVTAKNKQLDLDSKILDLEKEIEGVQADQTDNIIRQISLRNAERERLEQRSKMFVGPGGVLAYDSASWDKVSGSRKFGQIDPMTDKLSGVRVKASNEIRTMDETMADIFKEDVKKMADAYNSFLFDPIKAGTRALAGEIHQSLFGAMDDLERKFGRVGASMVGALEGVISKLIEAVMWSAVMSFVPGSQTFGQIFMNTVGLGGKGTTGRTNLANLSTPKRPTENVVLVEVQGKLGNDAIYLAGKNFIGRQKVATI